MLSAEPRDLPAEAAAASTAEAELVEPEGRTGRGRSLAARRSRLWLFASLALAVVLWEMVRGRPLAADSRDALVLWLLALACAVVASTPPLPARWPSQLWQAIRFNRAAWSLPLLLFTFALVVRIAGIDRFPYSFGGDEASQAMSAVAVLSGEMGNPFSTGWYALPTLYFFLEAASLRVFGDTVFGARALSAILGALAVLFTYLLAQRLFGRGTALVAAILLAAFHYHVHFSRLASNQIADPLFLVAALFFLHRGISERRPLDCVLAGMAVGGSQYFSYSGRLIPLVSAAYVLLLLVRDRGQAKGESGSLRPALGLLAWMAFGAGVAYLPLLAHYADKPGAFNARVNQVAIFAPGWFEEASKFFGKNPAELVVDNLRRAALFPFHTPPQGWYVTSTPFLGKPMAVLTALGLALATVRAFRREYFPLAIAYWGAVLMLALTTEPTATQRLVISTPVLAILAALGLRALVDISHTLVGMPARAASAAALLLVMALAAWNLASYFVEHSPNRRYFDENTLVATELARSLQDLGPGVTVYFAGPQRMWYYGFQSLPFIARNASGTDIERPLTPRDEPLPVTGLTVFAFLPERRGELAIAQAWYPGGTTREVRVPDFRAGDPPLLITYEVARR